VLLGDPQQLDQPLKGTHPPGAERSELGHLLGDHAVMPDHLGLFMERTWRLHPDVCEFTSEVFYERRLTWEPSLANQALHGVPPADGTLAVNFGELLERWTGGRVRATRHRVVAPKTARFSIPFFYEPRVDAEIAPLPLAGAEPFEPFLYGDYLWEAATNFVEMSGIKHLRQPRRAQASIGKKAS